MDHACRLYIPEGTEFIYRYEHSITLPFRIYWALWIQIMAQIIATCYSYVVRLARLKMTLVFVQNWLTIRIAVFGFKVTTKQMLLRLGTPYGGWYIPQSYLDSKMNKTLLSLGVGFDVSFDKELSKAGFNLILVDPLPVCISFAQEELGEYQNCSFENLAVSNFDGEVL